VFGGKKYTVGVQVAKIRTQVQTAGP